MKVNPETHREYQIQFIFNNVPIAMNPFLFLEYLTTRLPYILFVQSMYILNIQCSYKTIVKKISFS